MLLLALLVWGAGCRSEESAGPDTPDLELVVMLDERAGLEAGDRVMLRGFEVGTVHAVSLKQRVQVDLRVRAEHRDAVRSAAYGRAHEPTVGASWIEIVILDAESPIATDGTTLPGATSETDAAWLEGKHHAKDLAKRARDSLGESIDEEVERAGDAARKAASRAAEELRELGDDARGLTRKAGEAARRLRDSETVKEGVEKGKAVLDESRRRLKEWLD